MKNYTTELTLKNSSFRKVLFSQTLIKFCWVVQMLMSMHSMLKYILDTVFCLLKITCWLLCQHLVQCYYQPSLTKVTLWYVVLPKKLFISYVEKDCGTPPIDIENGHLSRSLQLYNTTYNSDIHYVCYNNSYVMVGSDTVRCTEDGTWSELPICHSKS